jgi:predicted PurR-regulated permease PerM
MLDDADASQERTRKILLAVIAGLISLLFLWMIHEFLVALLFAALLAGLAHPLYRRLVRRLGGRKSLASACTIVLVLLLVIGPTIGFFALVSVQAVELAQQARYFVEGQLKNAPRLDELTEHFPFLANLRPYREQIYGKAGEIAGEVGSYAVAMVTAAAKETASFFFMLFVMLYAMFFFLIDGRQTLGKILYYLPLPPEDENRLVDRFLSVTRATIKGTLVVGAVQGALGGVAFWAAGIEGAALWGTVMAVLSVLPGIGTALVWIPAVIYLFVVGRTGTAIGVLAWCTAIVGTIDNVLRPWLVGKDTKLSDLLILLSTLGGIVLFGALGIVIGPIIAALFVTIWDLYGAAFKDVLPAPEPTPSVLPPPVSEEPRS